GFTFLRCVLGSTRASHTGERALAFTNFYCSQRSTLDPQLLRQPARAAGEPSGDHESIGRCRMRPLRCILILPFKSATTARWPTTSHRQQLLQLRLSLNQFCTLPPPQFGVLF